jgi:hypothetical protein
MPAGRAARRSLHDDSDAPVSGVPSCVLGAGEGLQLRARGTVRHELQREVSQPPVPTYR